MKKVFIAITAMLGFLATGSVIFAQNAATSSAIPFRANERTTLESDETITGDFFATGEMVEIQGTVNGDLYAAGGNVVVEGTVNGDVLAAGGQIEISGTVAGNVRAFGGNIEIDGSVGENLTAVGGNIKITEQATITGSTVFAAGNVDLAGPVGGNVAGGVGNLVISNTVGGNIYAGVGTLQIEDGATIAGNIVYWGEEEAIIDPEATMSGTIEKRTPVEHGREPNREALRSVWTGLRFFSLLSMLFIGLLVLRFFPGVLETAAGFIDKKPWQALGFGFVKLIVEPIVAIILLATLIGIPLGLLLFGLYFAELYFASYVVAFWIGRLIWNRFNKKENSYWAFILGAVVFAIITSIPIISGLVQFLSLLFGLGAILLLKWSWYQKYFRKK